MARRETFSIRPLSAAAAVCFLSVALMAHGAERLQFNRDVRPILSDKCFACHGPEAASRQGGLRLDERDGAIGEADSGLTAVVPGDPAASELVARITSDDESLRMPPVDSHKTLTPEEAKAREI